MGAAGSHGYSCSDSTVAPMKPPATMQNHSDPKSPTGHMKVKNKKRGSRRSIR